MKEKKKSVTKTKKVSHRTFIWCYGWLAFSVLFLL